MRNYVQACYDLLNIKNPTIIICGGGLGLSAQEFKQRFPMSRMHIIEPVPALVANLKSCFCSEQDIVISQMAIGAVNEDIDIHIRNLVLNSGVYSPSPFFCAGHGNKAAATKEIIKVPCVTLPHYVENFTKFDKVNILEVVVEGSEYTILQGCSDYFNNIDIIIVVVITAPLYNQTYKWHDIDRILNENNFCLYNIHDLISNPKGRLLRAHTLYINKNILKD